MHQRRVIAKSAGGATCLVFIALGVLSNFRNIEFSYGNASGVIIYSELIIDWPKQFTGSRGIRVELRMLNDDYTHTREIYAPAPWLARFGWVRPRARPLLGGYAFVISTPLSLPLIVVGFPTAWLIWRDRRRHDSRFCRQCRYDLTGNASGICPECGLKISEQQRMSIMSGEESGFRGHL